MPRNLIFIEIANYATLMQRIISMGQRVRYPLGLPCCLHCISHEASSRYESAVDDQADLGLEPASPDRSSASPVDHDT